MSYSKFFKPLFMVVVLLFIQPAVSVGGEKQLPQQRALKPAWQSIIGTVGRSILKKIKPHSLSCCCLRGESDDPHFYTEAAGGQFASKHTTVLNHYSVKTSLHDQQSPFLLPAQPTPVSLVSPTQAVPDSCFVKMLTEWSSNGKHQLVINTLDGWAGILMDYLLHENHHLPAIPEGIATMFLLANACLEASDADAQKAIQYLDAIPKKQLCESDQLIVQNALARAHQKAGSPDILGRWQALLESRQSYCYQTKCGGILFAHGASIPSLSYCKYRLAKTHFEQMNVMEAIKNFEDSIECACVTARTGDLIAAYIALANLYQKIGSYEQALNYYQHAVILVTEEGCQKQLSKLNINIGNTYLALHKYHAALEYYTQALHLAHSCPDAAGNLKNCYNSLGAYYRSQGKYSNARTMFCQAQQCAQDRSEQDATVSLSTLGGQANLSLKKNHYLDALEKYQHILSETCSRTKYYQMMHNIGVTYFKYAEENVRMSDPDALTRFVLSASLQLLPCSDIASSHHTTMFTEDHKKQYELAAQYFGEYIDYCEAYFLSMKGRRDALCIARNLLKQYTTTAHYYQDCLIRTGNWKGVLVATERHNQRCDAEVELFELKQSLPEKTPDLPDSLPLSIKEIGKTVNLYKAPVIYIVCTQKNIVFYGMIPDPDTERVCKSVFTVPISHIRIDKKNGSYYLNLLTNGKQLSPQHTDQDAHIKNACSTFQEHCLNSPLTQTLTLLSGHYDIKKIAIIAPSCLESTLGPAAIRMLLTGPESTYPKLVEINTYGSLAMLRIALIQAQMKQ